MNLPNKLSLLRVALIPVMVALMLPQTLVCDLLAAAVFAVAALTYFFDGPGGLILPTLIFVVAAMTDWIDGHLARSRNEVTNFGKFIDPVADKLLNLSAMMMLVQRGTLPGWVVVLILARELAVDGLRMVAVGQGRVIAAGKLGKIKTASQMVMLLFVLITHQPALTAPAWDVASSTVLGAPWMRWISTALTLWVAAITLWSGIDYFVRNKDCIKDM